ncbi:hypothetical protein BGX38DRAFT_1269487 [Terfezia claveryi]|nr:hypothetical protein BGX38DRAFT_1269487 [Terfezia claveryi]
MKRKTKPEKPKSEGQRDSRIGRLLVPVKGIFRSSSRTSQRFRQPSPPPQTVGQGDLIKTRCKSDEQEGQNDLWSRAYKLLPEQYKMGLDNLDKLDIIQKLFDIAKQAEEEHAAKQFMLKWGNKEIDVQEKAKGFVSWLNKFKEIGDIVMQYDPAHAALPWAGVRFILMLVIGHYEKLAAAIIAMERIAILIGRCTIYEQLYLHSNDVPDIAEKATEDLRAAMLALYTAILQALSGLMMVFQGKTNILQPPEATLAELQGIEEPESVVDLAASAVDKCYSSHARIQNRGDSLELKALLQDFFPFITRMDATVSGMYEDSKEQERITILKWFSTVPYKGHHDLACDGCVENTAGAGKTKLVSTTIKYLSEISHGRVDKVVFFYCKRDEEDRRNRQKLLLALLLKRYKHPAIVLDALDECPEETRSLIIEDLHSILDNATHPVKVFIASRHSLDIEDHLQDLLHVRIEARDNAEDIENYVTKELALRVQNKKLLRGKISPALKQLIKDVLLRDAHGMFLWVDYQLRELCKLYLESDIRNHLRKLPKNLSGVYDEIMNSIESRPGTDFELATRALKWMLISLRPLKPQELVAATELNPSSAPPDQLPPEPSLDVDLVIHSGGRYGTALCTAATWGKLEMVTLLLDRGADINLTSGGTYGTALCAAAAWGKLEMVTLLLDRGADINLTSDGEFGTALCAAAAIGELIIATLLLDRGADINLTSCGIYGTALCAAAFLGKLEMVTLLLDQGADTNLTSGGSYGTALCTAVAWRKLEIVKLLLDRGADINLTSDGGFGTALCGAAAREA